MSDVANRSCWRLGMGATVVTDGVRFAVWAPNAARVDVQITGRQGETHHPLTAEGDGVYGGIAPGAKAGTRYGYRLDGGAAYPDPYSRFQPEGVHGPSEVVDPNAYRWREEGWTGLGPEGVVIYECHVGTFTPEGTFRALIGQLRELKRLGVTAIELMPVAECPGRWNWGYDGVDLFAPSHNYGRPDDLKRLVDAAHGVSLGVILDVVYNHLGPDGNYLRAFATDYFTDRHKTPWGDALNYDGPNSRWVRDFVVDNACYWLAEYHLDGLRLDATHAIIDDRPEHLLAELNRRARVVTPREVVLYAEDERRDVRAVHPLATGGYGLTGVWADDFHHAVRVSLTGEREGYYARYRGTTTEIARAIDDGFVLRSQASPDTGEPRGSKVTDEPASAFVFCIQNHDQIGNRAYGERLHHDVDAGRYAAASALLLFAPETPLLFMGQEFCASASFMFFTDHDEELGRKVTAGRRKEFARFRAFADPRLRAEIPDPQAEETFVRSKLNLGERQSNGGMYRLYRELLGLRRTDPVLAVQSRKQTRAEAIGAQVIAVHRWHGEDHRLLVANFGPSIGIGVAAQPILADLPLAGARLLLSTARRRFGGNGDRARVRGRAEHRRLEIPARTAAIFALTA